jgi:hypothetical protein
MSLYSSIDRKINADAWFLGLSHMGQLFWLRVLTGSHVTPLPGLWKATPGGLAHDFQMTSEQFEECFAEVTQDVASNGLPRIIANWSAGVLWLPKSLDHSCNQPRNLAVLLGWDKYVPLVVECEVKRQALMSWGQWLETNRQRFLNARGVKGLDDGAAVGLVDSLADSLRSGSWTVLRTSISTGSGTRSGSGSDTPKPPPTEHAQLRGHYAAEYQRTRGVAHALPKSQGGRYAKAASELLAAYGLAESKTIVSRALEHDWHGRNACELWQIVRSASNFRGATARPRANGNDPAALRARAAGLAGAGKTPAFGAGET